MNGDLNGSRVYKIVNTEIVDDRSYDNVYFETVESEDGQLGVRCCIRVNGNNLFRNFINKYSKYPFSKYCVDFLIFLCHRYRHSDKYESIVWCWPYDDFDYEIGKKKSYDRVIAKIESKKNKISRFVRHLEKYNLKTKYKK